MGGPNTGTSAARLLKVARRPRPLKVAHGRSNPRIQQRPLVDAVALTLRSGYDATLHKAAVLGRFILIRSGVRRSNSAVKFEVCHRVDSVYDSKGCPAVCVAVAWRVGSNVRPKRRQQVWWVSVRVRR